MTQIMKAWELSKPGGSLEFVDRKVPQPRAGAVLVKVEAVMLPSYLQGYVEGKLPGYTAPDRPFVPGSNAVGTIAQVGPDVWHLKQGQRVVLASHLVTQENVADRAQILLGITSFGGASGKMQENWPDGTLAEYAEWPVSAVTPVECLDDVPPEQLIAAARFAVPYGGLKRGRLAAGETVAISGATGAYGSAAVLLALAMGAARVVAMGRSKDSLSSLADLDIRRVSTVELTGDSTQDTAAVKQAAGGPIALAFDQVGQARDPSSTLTALGSLSRGGRLVLMGSMTVPLPINYLQVMGMDLEIIGQFMHEPGALAEVLALAQAGLLDLGAIAPKTFDLDNLPDAMVAARGLGNLQAAVVMVG